MNRPDLGYIRPGWSAILWVTLESKDLLAMAMMSQSWIVFWEITSSSRSSLFFRISCFRFSIWRKFDIFKG
jgi:hypothetical protein